MITVLPEREKASVERIFKEKNIEYNENSGCVIARMGDEVLGLCLYYLDKTSITVLHIEPIDDLMFSDGILRSALHVAAESFVLDARYAEFVDSTIFKRLGFIKDEKNRTLDTDKLFKGCNCHKN